MIPREAPPRRHPRSDLEGIGHVPSGRQGQHSLEITGDVDGLNRLLRFEQRRVAAHDDALGDAAERQDDIERHVQPGPDFDALACVLREARQLRDDVEDAWREVQEAVLSVGLADIGVRARNGRAYRRDRDPGQDTALGIADHTPHRAFAGDLRVGRTRRQEPHQGNQPQPLSHRCTIVWKRSRSVPHRHEVEVVAASPRVRQWERS